MDFHRAFFEIDVDGCGDITRDDLEHYMRRMNYQESFVQKWLNLFDIDQNGTISYEEYCTTLGLVPKPREVMEIKATTVQCTAHGKPPSKSKNGRNRTRNSKLIKGVMRFSGARVIQKKALYRYNPVSLRGKKTASDKKGTQFSVTKVKAISGANNGEQREVPLKRTPRVFPVREDKSRRKSKSHSSFSCHKHKLRKNLRPGSVVILLCGRHRGKRVIFLKQLESGLLLVTGPMKINGCPLRRVHQNYVIATTTGIDINETEVPHHINDEYFRRKRENRQRKLKEEGDIFRKEHAKYEVSHERKKLQSDIDSVVLSSIKRHQDGDELRQYLRKMFSLRRCDKPHTMVF